MLSIARKCQNMNNYFAMLKIYIISIDDDITRKVFLILNVCIVFVNTLSQSCHCNSS